METVTCSDCGHPSAVDLACEYKLCPGTAKTRWDAAVADEQRLIADLNEDDGTSNLLSRVDKLQNAFVNATRSAESRAWIRRSFTRDERAFNKAVSNWQVRRNAALLREREIKEAADRARIAEIRQRYQADPRITLDEFKLLLVYAYDDYDMDAMQLGASVESLLVLR